MSWYSFSYSITSNAGSQPTFFDNVGTPSSDSPKIELKMLSMSLESQEVEIGDSQLLARMGLCVGVHFTRVISVFSFTGFVKIDFTQHSCKGYASKQSEKNSRYTAPMWQNGGDYVARLPSEWQA